MTAIPYMGSKRKIAKKIVDYILLRNPETKYVYDLFGGGGAISFEFLKRKQIEKVFYNELNTGVVELLKKILKDGVTSDFYNWIDRKTFHEYKNDDTWKGGLIKTCWSFGNNSEKGYLYSSENEKIKKEAHDYLFKNGYTGKASQRNYLLKEYKEKYKRFEIQHLERLESLKRLQHLESLERLEISNLSYEEVKIETAENETIIYLDPPYENTTKYQKSICYKTLENYIKNSKYKIYLSGYESIGNLKEGLQIKHISSLSAIKTNRIIEKLFCNTDEKNKIYVQKDLL